MDLKTFAATTIGKLTSSAIKEFKLGSGSTWPGHIALKINKNFIKDITNQSKLEIILVAGTNGKTTTAKLIRHILEKNGLKVFQNDEGANLENGLATSLIKNSNIFGNFSYDVAIFEVDENNLPNTLLQTTPKAIIFLNLFRDQLDRYGELNTISSKWQKSLKKLSAKTIVILNSDDPEIRYLNKSVQGKILYYSVPDKYFNKPKLSHDTDSTHCPSCGNKLKFSKIAYSHIGKFACPKCKFTNINIKNKVDEKIPNVLFGTYNQYNLNAAVKTAKEIFEIPNTKIYETLKSFKPAFGRQEKIRYKNSDLLMLLSKNPAGFNQSISAVNEISKNPTVLIALNDRIPDGRDVSWIWDVEFESLAKSAKKIVLTGDRVYDLAVRLKYASHDYRNRIQIIETLDQAIIELIRSLRKDETAFILPTYSAMLELRKILTGKEIL